MDRLKILILLHLKYKRMYMYVFYILVRNRCVFLQRDFTLLLHYK